MGELLAVSAPPGPARLTESVTYRRNLHVGRAMASVLPLVMGGDVPRQFRWLRRSRSIYAAVVVFVLAVFALSGFFFATAIGVEERENLAQKDAIARSVAASIEAREQGYLNVLQSYAGRFRFRDSVKKQDSREAVVHLRQLHESFPEMDRVFLADRSGIVWATAPHTPEIHGRRYAFRDWYLGVSRTWQPYMSDVYETDLGHTLAVALVSISPWCGMCSRVVRGWRNSRTRWTGW